jgi:hypothetical protein
MNLKSRREPTLPSSSTPPLPDFVNRNLARALERIDEAEVAVDRSARAYAPPAIRNDQEAAITQVKTFGELPTRELDAIIAAAKGEIAALELDCQAIRDMYIKHTTRVAGDIKRLQDGVKAAMETMRVLREQCAQLDEPIVETKQGTTLEIGPLPPLNES